MSIPTLALVRDGPLTATSIKGQRTLDPAWHTAPTVLEGYLYAALFQHITEAKV